MFRCLESLAPRCGLEARAYGRKPSFDERLPARVRDDVGLIVANELDNHFADDIRIESLLDEVAALFTKYAKPRVARSFGCVAGLTISSSVHDVCPHDAWAQDGDADAGGRELLTPSFAHRDHGMLRRVIRLKTHPAHEAGERRGVDNV